MIDLADFFSPSTVTFILPRDAAEALLLDARLVKINDKYVIRIVLYNFGTEVPHGCWTTFIKIYSEGIFRRKFLLFINF